MNAVSPSTRRRAAGTATDGASGTEGTDFVDEARGSRGAPRRARLAARRAPPRRAAAGADGRRAEGTRSRTGSDSQAGRRETRRGDRRPPESGAGPGRDDDRRSAPDPRRRRQRQDARPGPPDRVSDRRPGRSTVADPRGHVHQPRRRRAARADHLARRRAGPRRPGGHVPRALRPRPPAGRRGDRDQPPLRRLRHRRPAGADEADPARGGHAADRRVPAVAPSSARSAGRRTRCSTRRSSPRTPSTTTRR